jgi:hypothetical protein
VSQRLAERERTTSRQAGKANLGVSPAYHRRLQLRQTNTDTSVHVEKSLFVQLQTVKESRPSEDFAGALGRRHDDHLSPYIQLSYQGRD